MGKQFIAWIHWLHQTELIARSNWCVHRLHKTKLMSSLAAQTVVDTLLIAWQVAETFSDCTPTSRYLYRLHPCSWYIHCLHQTSLPNILVAPTVVEKLTDRTKCSWSIRWLLKKYVINELSAIQIAGSDCTKNADSLTYRTKQMFLPNPSLFTYTTTIMHTFSSWLGFYGPDSKGSITNTWLGYELGDSVGRHISSGPGVCHELMFCMRWLRLYRCLGAGVLWCSVSAPMDTRA